MPQTFIAPIENDPDRRSAVVATVHFAHVTNFYPGVPHVREDAIRHAELSLQRDICDTVEVDRQLSEIEFGLLKECFHPGDSERIREAFAKIRALKAPELPEAKRHDVVKPVRSLRFLTGILLSTHGYPTAPKTDARVHIEIVNPIQDEMPTP